MMRTSEEAVRAVISTSLTWPQIEMFVRDASLWVDEELALPELEYGLSDGRLELIERYLACALIRMRDLGLTQSTTENVSEHYQVDPKVTEYLMRAADFDPTGTVRATFLVVAATGTAKPILARVGLGFMDDLPAE